MALAALATIAVPGFDAAGVSPAPADDEYERAIVIDGQGRKFAVQVPLTVAAGAALEADVAFLAAMKRVGAQLPFAVIEPAGFADLAEGGRALVAPAIPGAPIVMEQVDSQRTLAISLGRAIAAIHDLPHGIVTATAGTSYTAEDVRQRHLAELDDVAATGRVSARLLRRWEDVLEDISMWRFSPAIVHGDLAEENVLVTDGVISGVLDWADAHVGDPATDLAWLVSAIAPETLEIVLEAYDHARYDMDPHRLTRAELGAELALARWLLHGVRTGDDDIIADAVQMLDDLDEVTAREQERAAHAASVLAEVAAADSDRARAARSGVVKLGLSRAARGNDDETSRIDVSAFRVTDEDDEEWEDR